MDSNLLMVMVEEGQNSVCLNLDHGVSRVETPVFLEWSGPDQDPGTFFLREPVGGKILQGALSVWRGQEKQAWWIIVREALPSRPGSGLVFFPEDDTALAGQLGSIRENQSLQLGSGDFRLDRSIHLQTPVVIEGVSPEATFLESDGMVIRIGGPGCYWFSGLTFRSHSLKKGNVVVVDQGDVLFRECCFTGGRPEKISWMGNGLVVSGTARVTLERCSVFGNGASGVLVEKGGHLTLRQSRIFANGREGVTVGKEGVLCFSGNRCYENSWGLSAGEGSLLEVTGNVFEDNRLGGLLLFGRIQGTISRNTVWKNQVGVLCQAESQAGLEDNEIRDNLRGNIQLC